MNVFLDASVLVPVVTDQLANHPNAFTCYNLKHFKGLEPSIEVLSP